MVFLFTKEMVYFLSAKIPLRTELDLMCVCVCVCSFLWQCQSSVLRYQFTSCVQIGEGFTVTLLRYYFSTIFHQWEQLWRFAPTYLNAQCWTASCFSLPWVYYYDNGANTRGKAQYQKFWTHSSTSRAFCVHSLICIFWTNREWEIFWNLVRVAT